MRASCRRGGPPGAPACAFFLRESESRAIRKGRKERVVTVGRVGLRRSGLDLPFWFRVAVGLAEISAKFRGETVETGLQATWTPYWTLRRHYTGSPPRARRCVCVRAFASALSQRDRARPHVGACARGVGVGQIMCERRGSRCAHARAGTHKRWEFRVT